MTKNSRIQNLESSQTIATSPAIATMNPESEIWIFKQSILNKNKKVKNDISLKYLKNRLKYLKGFNQVLK